jgi:hypothetical protein
MKQTGAQQRREAKGRNDDGQFHDTAALSSASRALPTNVLCRLIR